MSPKVSSRCPSYDGGSDGTGKTSSPPLRGVCAWTGKASTAPAASARNPANRFMKHLLLDGPQSAPAREAHCWVRLVKGDNPRLSMPLPVGEVAGDPVSGLQ